MARRLPYVRSHATAPFHLHNFTGRPFVLRYIDEEEDKRRKAKGPFAPSEPLWSIGEWLLLGNITTQYSRYYESLLYKVVLWNSTYHIWVLLYISTMKYLYKYYYELALWNRLRELLYISRYYKIVLDYYYELVLCELLLRLL